jgi:8-oxo-dGTP pyrophosphatase MutT (NUDIX family)
MLMVERPSRASFGGVWAFPGGAVEAVDHDVDRFGFDAPWRAAALRETAEEVGIYLTDPLLATAPHGVVGGDVLDAVSRAGARFDPSKLRYISSWVTPEAVPSRFDARFYLAEVPPEVEAQIVTDELVDLAWASAAQILDRVENGSWAMLFPTLWHVRQIASTESPMQLAQHPRRQIIAPVEPFDYVEFGIPEEELA